MKPSESLLTSVVVNKGLKTKYGELENFSFKGRGAPTTMDRSNTKTMSFGLNNFCVRFLFSFSFTNVFRASKRLVVISDMFLISFDRISICSPAFFTKSCGCVMLSGSKKVQLLPACPKTMADGLKTCFWCYRII